MEAVERRHDGLVDLDADRTILLAVSDNGPQMTSGSTREFITLCAIAQHFGRPGTPTDQAWVESFNGHLRAEFPHLLAIRPQPAPCLAPEEPAHSTHSGYRRCCLIQRESLSQSQKQIRLGRPLEHRPQTLHLERPPPKTSSPKSNAAAPPSTRSNRRQTTRRLPEWTNCRAANCSTRGYTFTRFPTSRSPCAMANSHWATNIGHGMAGSRSLAVSAYPDQRSCFCDRPRCRGPWGQ